MRPEPRVKIFLLGDVEAGALAEDITDVFGRGREFEAAFLVGRYGKEGDETVARGGDLGFGDGDVRGRGRVVAGEVEVGGLGAGDPGHVEDVEGVVGEALW